MSAATRAIWEWLGALQEVALVRFAGVERGRTGCVVRVWRPADYDREVVPTFTGVWDREPNADAG